MSKKRYQAGPRCRNCDQPNHREEFCPEDPRIPKCYICGVEWHESKCIMDCPNRRCTLCGDRTHLSHQCSEFYSRRPCERCKQVGHPSKLCPDVWRQFHLVTTTAVNSRSAEPPNAVLIPPERRFCSLCSARGHLAPDCKTNLRKKYPHPGYIPKDYQLPSKPQMSAPNQEGPSRHENQEQRSNRHEECPSHGEEGPSRREEGPSRREEGPSRREEGPSRREEGPSRREEGPSRPERQEGPSRSESIDFVELTSDCSEDSDVVELLDSSNNNNVSSSRVPVVDLTLEEDFNESLKSPQILSLSFESDADNNTPCASISATDEVTHIALPVLVAESLKPSAHNGDQLSLMQLMTGVKVVAFDSDLPSMSLTGTPEATERSMEYLRRILCFQALLRAGTSLKVESCQEPETYKTKKKQLNCRQWLRSSNPPMELVLEEGSRELGILRLSSSKPLPKGLVNFLVGLFYPYEVDWTVKKRAQKFLRDFTVDWLKGFPFWTCAGILKVVSSPDLHLLPSPHDLKTKWREFNVTNPSKHVPLASLFLPRSVFQGLVEYFETALDENSSQGLSALSRIFPGHESEEKNSSVTLTNLLSPSTGSMWILPAEEKLALDSVLLPPLLAGINRMNLSISDVMGYCSICHLQIASLFDNEAMFRNTIKNLSASFGNVVQGSQPFLDFINSLSLTVGFSKRILDPIPSGYDPSSLSRKRRRPSSESDPRFLGQWDGADPETRRCCREKMDQFDGPPPMVPSPSSYGSRPSSSSSLSYTVATKEVVIPLVSLIEALRPCPENGFPLVRMCIATNVRITAVNWENGTLLMRGNKDSLNSALNFLRMLIAFEFHLLDHREMNIPNSTEFWKRGTEIMADQIGPILHQLRTLANVFDPLFETVALLFQRSHTYYCMNQMMLGNVEKQFNHHYEFLSGLPWTAASSMLEHMASGQSLQLSKDGEKLSKFENYWKVYGQVFNIPYYDISDGPKRWLDRLYSKCPFNIGQAECKLLSSCLDDRQQKDNLLNEVLQSPPAFVQPKYQVDIVLRPLRKAIEMRSPTGALIVGLLKAVKIPFTALLDPKSLEDFNKPSTGFQRLPMLIPLMLALEQFGLKLASDAPLPDFLVGEGYPEAVIRNQPPEPTESRDQVSSKRKKLSTGSSSSPNDTASAHATSPVTPSKDHRRKQAVPMKATVSQHSASSSSTNTSSSSSSSATNTSSSSSSSDSTPKSKPSSVSPPSSEEKKRRKIKNLFSLPQPVSPKKKKSSAAATPPAEGSSEPMWSVVSAPETSGHSGQVSPPIKLKLKVNGGVAKEVSVVGQNCERQWVIQIPYGVRNVLDCSLQNGWAFARLILSSDASIEKWNTQNGTLVLLATEDSYKRVIRQLQTWIAYECSRLENRIEVDFVDDKTFHTLVQEALVEMFPAKMLQDLCNAVNPTVGAVQKCVQKRGNLKVVDILGVHRTERNKVDAFIDEHWAILERLPWKTLSTLLELQASDHGMKSVDYPLEIQTELRIRFESKYCRAFDKQLPLCAISKHCLPRISEWLRKFFLMITWPAEQRDVVLKTECGVISEALTDWQSTKKLRRLNAQQFLYPGSEPDGLNGHGVVANKPAFLDLFGIALRYALAQDSLTVGEVNQLLKVTNAGMIPLIFHNKNVVSAIYHGSPHYVMVDAHKPFLSVLSLFGVPDDIVNHLRSEWNQFRVYTEEVQEILTGITFNSVAIPQRIAGEILEVHKEGKRRVWTKFHPERNHTGSTGGGDVERSILFLKGRKNR